MPKDFMFPRFCSRALIPKYSTVMASTISLQNIGHAALEALNDFQANVLAKELQAWCVFVARRSV